jgi:hypothetical protein
MVDPGSGSTGKEKPGREAVGKGQIIVELDSNATPTPSIYLDVFGWVRDRDTTACVGRWADVPGHDEGEKR